MRRLIVLVLLSVSSVGLVALGTAPAQACGVTPKPRAEQLQAAPLVFDGQVASVRRSANDPDMTEYTVEVKRVYRGRVSTTETVVAPSKVSTCGLRGVKPGTTLMFLAQQGKDEMIRTASFLGTSSFTPQVRREVEEAVGEPSPPAGAASDDGESTGTIVDDSDPPSVATAVTPGIAIMVLGLLVLILARIFGRAERL